MQRDTVDSYYKDQLNTSTIHRVVTVTAKECLNEREHFISSD